MENATPRIAQVASDGSTCLTVVWRTGIQRHVDLAGWIATGGDALAPLRDPAVFALPHVAEHGAAVAWTDNDDLMIDAVHLEQITAEQQPFDASRAAAWQKALALSNQESADFLGISLSTWNAYKAGAKVPAAIGMLCRAAERDPILLQAHLRPRRAGRPRGLRYAQA